MPGAMRKKPKTKKKQTPKKQKKQKLNKKLSKLHNADKKTYKII